MTLGAQCDPIERPLDPPFLASAWASALSHSVNLPHTVAQFPGHKCLFAVSKNGMADCITCFEITPLP